jgi:photosystem II stability/assembly factor-like uncharacterized protein
MRHLLLAASIACLALHSKAQNKKTPVREPAKPNPDSVYSSLKWRNVGPFRGGRTNAVCGVPGNDLLYYAGYTGGGVWKTEDGGTSWKNISDGFFTTGSIGDIAVAPSDPNVIYVGSGEHAVRGVMTSFGDGVYKSNDAGRTWNKAGLEKTRHISDVVVHPKQSDIVYVAAQGTVHGNNNDRGVFRSTDGGQTWKKVLFVNDSTGASSLSMDPSNPRILYAATWEHRRLPWSVRSGGPGSAIWKSTDGGDNWQKLTEGLPSFMGKIGLSVSPANPNRVFAIVETEKSKSGLYRSDDAGKTWSLLSNDQDISSRSWYYMEVAADPQNANIVYVLNAPLMRSIDGGKTFQPIRVGHGDTHDLWINPTRPETMILGDDGGAEITHNGGKSWSTLMNQPTAQFYRVATDNTFPYRLYGGQQDNTSVVIASRNNGNGITERDWTTGAGCESAFMAFDPAEPTVVYGGCYQGYIERLDMRTMESKDIQAYPSLNLAVEPRSMKYRFNWNAPIVASPHDPKTIYHGGNVLLRTIDGGTRWEAISPDLTRNEKGKQGPGGGPLTNEGAGGENYNTLAYVIESTLEKGVIWTGSDCGLLHLTTDGGKAWSNVTPPDLPEALVHSIETSPHSKGTAFVCATRYKFNDYGSYAYRTEDYGKTWKRIGKGIKDDDFLRVIREDRKVKGLLYGGSERGFYISFDNGDNWQPFQRNLPVVTVTDLAIRDNDLVAATAGRAFWILDDLGAIQQSQQNSTANTLRVFTPKPSYRYGNGSSLTPPAPGGSTGHNAPEGVVIDYRIPDISESDTLFMDILDAQGKVVRTYSSRPDISRKSYPGGPWKEIALPAAKGMNRFLWDFRTATVSPDVEGVYIYGDYRGHRLAPGAYSARLRLRSETATASFSVLQDPRIKATPSDWKEQQAYLEKVTGSIGDMHRSVNDLRKVRTRLEQLGGSLSDDTATAALRSKGRSIIGQIDAWESEIVETRIRNGQDVINWPSKLNAEYFNLKGLADAHDPEITAGMKERLADLEGRWKESQKELEGIRTSIAEYNEMYRKSGTPAIRYR